MSKEKKKTELTEEELKAFSKKVYKGLAIYAVFCLLVSILFHTVLMLSLIPSCSMENTIMTGEFVIATRYDCHDIERYDILIFVPPDDRSCTYIKRVIGLPGETIEVKNGKVYADGVELDNSFTKGPQNRKGDGVYKVPEGHYFFLGDNRNNSKDSRYWKNKYVPLEDIQAKARFVIFPFRMLDYKEE